MAINRAAQSSVQSGLPKFDSIWDGRSAVGSMEAISSITLSAAQATVDFNTIPQTYSHLQIRGIARDASTNGSLRIRINNDTNNNYGRHVLYGDGTSVASSGSFGDNIAVIGDISISTSTSSVFAPFIVDILDYTSVYKHKTIRSLCAYDANGSGFVELRSTSYANGTSGSIPPISSLSIFLPTTNLAAYSSFSLYGIK